MPIKYRLIKWLKEGCIHNSISMNFNAATCSSLRNISINKHSINRGEEMARYIHVHVVFLFPLTICTLQISYISWMPLEGDIRILLQLLTTIL